MNAKLKFSYEDAVDYVLGRLSEEKKKLFEEEMKTNEELQDLIKLAEANKEQILEIEKYQFEDEFYENLLHKVKNLSSKEYEYKPGYVFKLDTSGFSQKEKLLIKDLYFLVLSNPESSITGKDVRVIPLSRLINYTQKYDLVITDKVISSKQFNVVAHMHLVTNVLVERLKYFIGELNTQNLNAIVKKDFGDASLIDEEKILSGTEFRKRFPIDEYFEEEFESWYSMVKNVLEKLKSEVFEYAEEKLDRIPEEYLFDKVSTQEMMKSSEVEQMHFLFNKMIEPKQKYLIDDEGFLVVDDTEKMLFNRFKVIPKTLNLNRHSVDIDRIRDMVYKEINLEEKEYLKKNLLTNYKIQIKSYSEFFEQEYRLAARRIALEEIPEDSLELYVDDRFSIIFAIYNNRLFLEVNFLGNEKVKFIENFHFVLLANSSGFMIPRIDFEDNRFKIPFDLSKEEMETMQEGYIVGFIYNNTSVKLYLRLLFH